MKHEKLWVKPNFSKVSRQELPLSYVGLKKNKLKLIQPLRVEAESPLFLQNCLFNPANLS